MPARRTERGSTVTRSARWPGVRWPASQPRVVMPASVAAVRRSAGRWWPRRSVARRSLSSTALASSNRSITAWLSEPRQRGLPASASDRAGPIPSARSRSVVGQKQAVVRVAPRRATSSPVRWVAWTAVVRGPRTPADSARAAGVRPVAASRPGFGPLLGQVEMEGGVAAVRPGGHRGHGRRVDRPDAVDAGRHPDPGPFAEGAGALGHALASPSPKRTCAPASAWPSNPARR